MLVAPTEPPAMKTLGRTSSKPEQFGADVLWGGNGKLCGVQRKEMKDLLASLSDGRLAKEIGQMQRLDLAVLIIEGRPKWTTDGELVARWGQRWSKQSHRGLVLSVQQAGVMVVQTEDVAETVEAVRDVQRWAAKERHVALQRRPKPAGSWGKAGCREYQLHLLQSFDLIGPVQAERMLEHFGRVPLKWDVGVEEMVKVPGIGKVRAKKLMEALDGG